MSGWMILWTILLAGGALGMVGLLLVVTVGAVSELRESLDELSGDPANAPAEESTVQT
jgi:hypothetical protein